MHNKIMNSDKRLIPKDLSFREVLNKMDPVTGDILFVLDDNQDFLGTLGMKEIRKWFSANRNFHVTAYDLCNKASFLLNHFELNDPSLPAVLEKQNERIIPVVSLDKKIIGHIEKNQKEKKSQLPENVAIVIMAGGQGTRMAPFTKILPKALIPVGEKALIEIIVDHFHQFSANNFYISVNHRAQMIRSYFEELTKNYSVKYIEEDKPLGTGGALSMLKGKIDLPFFVTNCDTLIKEDYSDIYQFHMSNKNDITIIGCIKSYSIPYGVCRFENSSTLFDQIEEKPTFDFIVNTGMYVINPQLLDLIPENTFYNLPDLIQKCRELGGKIDVFSIYDKAWLDVGRWEEYRKTADFLDRELSYKEDFYLWH